MTSRRLLIASPYPHFLAEHANFLTSEFEIQRANSEDVILFLAKEWAPQIIVVDGDSNLYNSCGKIRSRFSFEAMGLVLITKELTSPREERAMRWGCDQVLGIQLVGPGFALKLKALADRISPVQGQGALPNGLNGSVRPEPIRFGEIEVFPVDHLLKRGENIVTMTPIQFKLLLLFLQNREQLLSRQIIKEKIWQDTEISLRSIDAQISKLRKIVPEIDPHLVNIYGKGYIFTEHRRQAA